MLTPSDKLHIFLKRYSQKKTSVDGGGVGDSWDTRQWPDPFDNKIPYHDNDAECTCRNNDNQDSYSKLSCPVHGLNGKQDSRDWAMPEASPVGYPQDQPRNWEKARLTATEDHIAKLNKEWGHRVPWKKGKKLTNWLDIIPPDIFARLRMPEEDDLNETEALSHVVAQGGDYSLSNLICLLGGGARLVGLKELEAWAYNQDKPWDEIKNKVYDAALEIIMSDVYQYIVDATDQSNKIKEKKLEERIFDPSALEQMKMQLHMTALPAVDRGELEYELEPQAKEDAKQFTEALGRQLSNHRN